jgi:hypothetical protein
MELKKLFIFMTLILCNRSYGLNQSAEHLFNSLPTFELNDSLGFYKTESCVVTNNNLNEVLYYRDRLNSISYQPNYVPLMGLEALGNYNLLMSTNSNIMYFINGDFFRNLNNSDLNLISKDKSHFVIYNKSSEKSVFEYAQLIMDTSSTKSISLKKFDYPQIAIKKVNDYSYMQKLTVNENKSYYIICETPEIQRSNLKPIVVKECGLKGSLNDRLNDCDTQIINPNTDIKKLDLVSKQNTNTHLYKISKENQFIFSSNNMITINHILVSNEDPCQKTIIQSYGTDFDKKWLISTKDELSNLLLVNQLDPEDLYRTNSKERPYEWLSHNTDIYAPRAFYCTGY